MLQGHRMSIDTSFKSRDSEHIVKGYGQESLAFAQVSFGERPPTSFRTLHK